MVREIRSTTLRYGLALGLFGLVLLLSFGLARIFPFRIDFTSLIIIAMIATAWYLGRGPGLIFALLFEITLDYFSTAPLTTRTSIIIFNRMVLFVSLVLFASSRRDAEKRLSEQREWFQVTLSSIGDAMIATDVKGVVNFINPVAAAITGWSPAQATGKPLTEVFQIINEETREPVDNPFSTIKREGIVVGLANHTILIAKDGREIPIEDRGAPIKDSRGNIIGVIVVFHDVSERRKTEHDLELMLKREQAARSEAETSDRLKDEFLATVSHELRTPLSSILGWSAMINRGGLNQETTRNALKIIERNAKAQAEIISDILDVSRIITGKLSIKARLVELAPIIQGAIDTQRLAASVRAISITASLEPHVGLVTGDPDRLQQIVWNLISNAIKFTRNGGRIEVHLERVDNHVQLRVTDSGIGISKQFLPYVFDRFRQEDSSTTRAHSGLGLGLAIVRHLVELHGGTVAAHSAGEGMGATFTIQLPLANERNISLNQRATLVAESEEISGLPATPDLTGLRILVVDDHPDSLEILVVMLSEFGATVRTEDSSIKGLEALLEWQPDVLVSDLEMPGEDGYQFISKIRDLAVEQVRDIPAAALSAHVREEDRARALAAGYQLHIKKPVDPVQLASEISKLMKHRRKRNSV